MRKWKTAVLCIVSVFMLIAIFPMGAHGSEQEKVIVEAVGWFTHFPMQATRNVIEETCEKFGDQVELTLYDESRQEGQDFLTSKGLAGHIPMRLYINGENAFNLDGQDVAFRDFVDYQWWTAADLERAITLALESGVEDIAIEIPDEFAVAGSGSGGGSNLPIIVISIVGVVIIALAGYFIFKPKKTGAKKPVKKGRV